MSGKWLSSLRATVGESIPSSPVRRMRTKPSVTESRRGTSPQKQRRAISPAKARSAGIANHVSQPSPIPARYRKSPAPTPRSTTLLPADPLILTLESDEHADSVSTLYTKYCETGELTPRDFMSGKQLNRLARDAGIIDRRITTGVIDVVMRQAAHWSSEGAPVPKRGNIELTYPQFLVALVMLAVKKYPNRPPSEALDMVRCAGLYGIPALLLSTL